MTLPEVRCPRCHALLFCGIYLTIHVVCRKCKRHVHDTCQVPNAEALALLLTRGMQYASRLDVLEKPIHTNEYIEKPVMVS